MVVLDTGQIAPTRQAAIHYFSVMSRF